MTRELNPSKEMGMTGNPHFTGHRGVPGGTRSVDLESLLPEGHPARLCWEHVCGSEVTAEIIKASKGASSSLPLFALWLFAASKGVGGAEDLAWLCQHTIGFKWLSSDLAVDAKSLAAFRHVEAEAVDELLAQCLLALRGSRGAPAADQLLAQYAEARRHILVLRQRLADPLAERCKRRDAAALQRRSLRRARIESAGADFRRLLTAREAEAARLAEQRLAEQRAAEQRLAEQRLAQEKLAAEQRAAEARRAAEATARQPAGAQPRPQQRRFVSLTSLDWGGAADGADGRFKRILTVTLLVFVALSVPLALIEPPPVERQKEEKIPQRLTKLFEEQQSKPKLEKPKLPEPKLEEPIKPKEELPKEKPSETPSEVKAPAKAVEPKPAPGAAVVKNARPAAGAEVAAARERASQTGLVAMRDQLAAMRDLSGTGTESLRSTTQSKVGSEGTQGQAERDLIGRAAGSGSGGVATQTVAHAGGGSLETRATSKVSVAAGRTGAGGTGAGGALPSIAEVEREAKGSKRTPEEIKLAFDANKSAIYGIYRRALRENPLLEGRVVLKLTIDPAGNVTACNVVSSGLKDPELEGKLVARIMLINFGTRPKLETWTGNYQIDFVPAS
jgi:periplasmic protein TonB